MKTTTAKLDVRLEAMTQQELKHFARNVVWSLYARSYSADEKGIDEELDALGLADEEVYLDSDKEWTASTVEEVAEDVSTAALHPDDL